MTIRSHQRRRAAIREALTKTPLSKGLPVAAGTLAVCVGLAPMAHGQEAQRQEQTLRTIKAQDEGGNEPQTTTIGRVPQTLRDVPQSLTVISRQTIEAQAATRLTDALRNVPGITISAGEGGQIGDNINLRGFSARTDLFLDGFRDRGQYSRDTFFLEAVEVLKGPSSILFGRGSTGGVINQVSKKAGGRDHADLSVSLGTENYFRVTADLNERLSETSAFRVSALGHYNESTRDIVESTRYGINPSVRVGIGTPLEVQISAVIQRNREVPDYGLPLVAFREGTAQPIARPIDAPANNFYGFTDDRFDQDVNNLNISLQFKLNDNATITNLSQYSTYKTVASPTPLGGLVNPTTGAAINQPIPAGTPLTSLWAIRQQRDRELHDSSLYNQTNLTWVIPGAITQTILAGIELGRDEYLNDTFLRMNGTATPSPLSNISPIPPINLGAPVYEPKPPLTGNVTRQQSQRTEASGDTIAAYVNDQLDLSESWKLVLGVRWDDFQAEQRQFNYTYALPINVPTATITETTLERTDVMWSPRAGVIWQPTTAQSYYVSYGTSFNPAGESLTLSANNASTEPEENRSFEVGAKLGLFSDALLLTTAIFRVEKTNARTADPSGGTVQVTDGVTRVDGIEVGAIGRLTPNWDLMAGYSFLDGEIVKSHDVGTGVSLGIPAEGKTPQNTPEHTATLWTTYRFFGAWEVGGGLVYSSDRYVNNFETAVIDGYTRADLTVAFVQTNYSIRLNLLNATDEFYFETASAGRATPATGRTAVATGTYRF